MTAPSFLVQPEKDLAARAVPHVSQSPFWMPIGGPSRTPIDTFAFVADHARAGATTLISDPGRTFFPKAKLARLADYRVPVTRDLEDAEIKHTAVWTISPDSL